MVFRRFPLIFFHGRTQETTVPVLRCSYKTPREKNRLVMYTVSSRAARVPVRLYRMHKLNFEIARIALGRRYRSFYIFLLERRIQYILMYQA